MIDHRPEFDRDVLDLFMISWRNPLIISIHDIDLDYKDII